MTETGTATARKIFRVLGTTDDVTQCECCGRANLKATVILLPLDYDGNADGEPTYFGSACGAKAAGWTTKEIRTAAKTADRAAAEAARIERDRLDGIEYRRIRSLDGTADCYMMPGICRIERKGDCVAHPAGA